MTAGMRKATGWILSPKLFSSTPLAELRRCSASTFFSMRAVSSSLAYAHAEWGRERAGTNKEPILREGSFSMMQCSAWPTLKSRLNVAQLRRRFSSSRSGSMGYRVCDVPSFTSLRSVGTGCTDPEHASPRQTSMSVLTAHVAAAYVTPTEHQINTSMRDMARLRT